MLVLTRRREEEIVIGDDIVVRVVDIKGDRVRIAIEAPREVGVHRREVFDDIKARSQAVTE
ncbi:MAG: carbon storage regulator CsrA, partial [Phycisphaerales bacterium]|nr:carbon storage regulator CsrA [Phycisphaerales bacterium]